MLLSGYVDINLDGSVRSYTMDHPEKIPPVVLGVIKQTVQAWRFQVKVTGKVIARAKMSLRIVAKPVERSKFTIGVEKVQFADDSSEGALPYDHATPRPHYPRDAIDLRTSTDVYLLVRIGRDGHVLDVGAEQVDFTLECPPASRTGLEKQFAKAGEVAISQWTFKVPKGSAADAPCWYARVPVTFTLDGELAPALSREYGAWQPYLPGARRDLPWLKDKGLVASAPDAMPDGKPSLLDGAVQLATE